MASIDYAPISIGVTIFLTVYSYLHVRIKRLEDHNVEGNLCDQRYTELKNRLDRGETRFSDIDRKLNEQLVLLTKVATTVNLIARKNGINSDE